MDKINIVNTLLKHRQEQLSAHHPSEATLSPGAVLTPLGDGLIFPLFDSFQPTYKWDHAFVMKWLLTCNDQSPDDLNCRPSPSIKFISIDLNQRCDY